MSNIPTQAQNWKQVRTDWEADKYTSPYLFDSRAFTLAYINLKEAQALIADKIAQQVDVVAATPAEQHHSDIIGISCTLDKVAEAILNLDDNSSKLGQSLDGLAGAITDKESFRMNQMIIAQAKTSNDILFRGVIELTSQEIATAAHALKTLEPQDAAIAAACERLDAASAHLKAAEKQN